jgi:hypothetical protein
VVKAVKGIGQHPRLGIYLAAGLCALAQTAHAGSNLPCNFDILGLKLGMSAQEAQSAIRQHLNITPESSPDSYKIHSTPRRYQSGGNFVDDFVISNGRMELILDFTEVYPGQGGGPESLYWISYTLVQTSPADKDNFVERVLARYGHPVFVANQEQDFWSDRPYQSADAALRAGVPVLELDVSVPKLILTNQSIRQKMEKAFTELQRIPL